jgi:hypothetical protein
MTGVHRVCDGSDYDIVIQGSRLLLVTYSVGDWPSQLAVSTDDYAAQQCLTSPSKFIHMVQLG